MIRECLICEEEFDAKGGQLICSKEHYFECSFCKKLVEIKSLQQIKNKNIKRPISENLLPFFVVENNEKRCVITFIRLGCKSCNIAAGREVRNITCLDKYGVKDPAQLPEVKEKTKQTNKKRYGIDYPSKLEEMKRKVRQTNLDRYGAPCSMQNPQVKERSKQTCLGKYGNEYYMTTQEFKDKSRETNLKNLGVEHPLKSDKVKEKMKETNQTRYGVDYVFQAESIKDKIKNTFLNKYGKESSMQSPEVRERSKQTCLDHYGVDNPMKSEEVREKYINTMRERYGVDNPTQLEEFRRKASNTMMNTIGSPFPPGAFSYNVWYKIKDKVYYLKSLWELIFAEYLRLNNIEFEYETLEFPYLEGNRKHIYRPDFYTPSKNKIVEVKGFIREEDLEKIKLKEESVPDTYEYEVITDISSYLEFVTGCMPDFEDIVKEIKRRKIEDGEVYFYDTEL